MRRDSPRRFFDEYYGQPEVLKAFASSRFPTASGGSILVGAGDSYAAALAAFYATSGRCLALDPYSLIAYSEMAKGREVFFISVSGRTSSNVAAAKKVSALAGRTTAITSDSESKLAQLTDRTVRLPMKAVPRTPGLLSFTTSLLAVLKITRSGFTCDFGRALRDAESTSKEAIFGSGRGTTYFLGNGAAYAVSLYAAAKVYEFIGAKAHAELLEEFGHLQLFALRKSDTVNIFASFDPSGVGFKLHGLLSARGYACSLVQSKGNSAMEEVFHSVFAAQLAVLHEVQRVGISEPRFLRAKDRLEISDGMIY
jgi:hypothetical protein